MRLGFRSIHLSDDLCVYTAKFFCEKYDIKPTKTQIKCKDLTVEAKDTDILSYITGIDEFVRKYTLEPPANRVDILTTVISFLEICFVLEANEKGLDPYKDFDAIIEHVENLINS